MNKEILKIVEEKFKNVKYGQYYFEHTLRVTRLATKIAEKENANKEIVEIASLLHDIARPEEDNKIIEDHAKEGAKKAREILKSLKYDEKFINEVCYCIENHRFSHGKKPETLESKILQDADRLDAIGAIGLINAIIAAHETKLKIYDPSLTPKQKYDGKPTTLINLLIEKMLKIKDTLNTKTAKELAEDRHKFLESFLNQFLKEWKEAYE